MNELIIEQMDTTVITIKVDENGADMTRKSPDGDYKELHIPREDLHWLAQSLMENALKGTILGETEVADAYFQAAFGVLEFVSDQ